MIKDVHAHLLTYSYTLFLHIIFSIYSFAQFLHIALFFKKYILFIFIICVITTQVAQLSSHSSRVFSSVQSVCGFFHVLPASMGFLPPPKNMVLGGLAMLL